MATTSAGGSNEVYQFKLYRYTPSSAAAIVATAVFGILTLAHLFRLIKARTYFCLPFVIGGLCM